ncbi:MAG TPA: LysM peptidoglycan-binding domain-containing protein [Acidimicrobiales bacterium]|nr:LysM peptidoglycan-binding domain-containing protein [Acidimicrobiales bacterium]
MKTRSMRGALAAFSLATFLLTVALAGILPSGDAYAGTVTVQPGQTLSQVAIDEHTTVAALMAANNIGNPDVVLAGTVLQVPGSTPAPAPPAPAPVATVTVQLGQTLSQVASQEHSTVAALVAANNIGNPNFVVAGTVLRVPGPGATTVTTSTVTAAPAYNTVEVRSGDTLSSLAARFGTTAGVLASVNHLADPNLVLAGTVLQLPTSSTAAASGPTQVVAGGTVTVRPGDTLTSLAAHYGTTAAALASVNHITNPNVVFAGMQLTLPAGVLVATATAVAPAGGDADGGTYPAPLLAHPDRLALLPDFVHSASVWGVPLSLLEALCWWESGWQNDVVSATGAMGVCQIEPTTAAFVNSSILQTSDLDPRSAADNIALSAAYLRYLLNRTGGNASAALADYYQGLVSVQQKGLLPSTQTYVAGILAYASIFAGHG